MLQLVASRMAAVIKAAAAAAAEPRTEWSLLELRLLVRWPDAALKMVQEVHHVAVRDAQRRQPRRIDLEVREHLRFLRRQLRRCRHISPL